MATARPPAKKKAPSRAARPAVTPAAADAAPAAAPARRASAPADTASPAPAAKTRGAKARAAAPSQPKTAPAAKTAKTAKTVKAAEPTAAAQAPSKTGAKAAADPSAKRTAKDTAQGAAKSVVKSTAQRAKNAIGAAADQPVAEPAAAQAAKETAKQAAKPAAKKAARKTATQAPATPAASATDSAPKTPAVKKTAAKKAAAKTAVKAPAKQAAQAPTTQVPAQAAADTPPAPPADTAAAPPVSGGTALAAKSRGRTRGGKAQASPSAARPAAPTVATQAPQAQTPTDPVPDASATAAAVAGEAEPLLAPTAPDQTQPAGPTATAPADNGAAEASSAAEAAAVADADLAAATDAHTDADADADADAEAVAEADAAHTAAAPVAPAPAPRTPLPTSGAAHSVLALTAGDWRRVQWRVGSACPAALRRALDQRLDEAGLLADDADAVLQQLLRQAAELRHTVQVSPAVWPHLAAHRDARSRCAVLAAHHPEGPASPALQRLLSVGLAPFQAEGALWAVAAGRALLADAPGLGKAVQALAAARLWQQHFGLRRVLVVCPPAGLLRWQRDWRVLAGQPAQALQGTAAQRQQAWAAEADVRLITPGSLADDAAQVAAWGPELLVVDEPQQLGLDHGGGAGLAALQSLQVPQVLVLCGAALETQPALLEQLVDWLDQARLGPLAALREVRQARDTGTELDDEAIDRVSQQLSRVLLQRQPAEVAEQLPPVVYSPRLAMLDGGQRQAHATAHALAQRLLQGWQRTGLLSDSDQWRLSEALVAMQQAARRVQATAERGGARADGLADPGNDGAADAAPPALAEPLVQALLAALDAELPQAVAPATDAAPDTVDGSGSGSDSDRPDPASAEAARPVVLCEHAADRAQLAPRLRQALGPARAAQVQLLAPDDAVPPGALTVLQIGAPWRPRRRPLARQASRHEPRPTPDGAQRWLCVAAADSLDAGLLDTLGLRGDTPRGPAEPGGQGFLEGAARRDWLQALAAALDQLG